jgi:hypothetical protein
MKTKKNGRVQNLQRSDLKRKPLNRQEEKLKIAEGNRVSSSDRADDFDPSTRDSSGTAIDVNPQPRMGEPSGNCEID